MPGLLCWASADCAPTVKPRNAARTGATDRLLANFIGRSSLTQCLFYRARPFRAAAHAHSFVIVGRHLELAPLLLVVVHPELRLMLSQEIGNAPVGGERLLSIHVVGRDVAFVPVLPE